MQTTTSQTSTPYTPILALLALASVIAGCVLSAAMGATDGITGFSSGITVNGLFCTGLAVLLLEAATLIEKQYPAKAIWGGLAIASTVLAAILSTIGLYLSPTTEDPQGTLAGLLCIMIPVIFVLSIPGIIAFSHLPGAMRARRVGSFKETLRDTITREKGEVNLSEIASRLGISELQAVDHITAMINTKEIEGTLEADYHRFYTGAALRAKYDQLLGIVAARGSARVEDLAIELDAPAPLVRSWIYTLVRGDTFTGYINWDEGKLYSVDGQQLIESSRCPRCQGRMNLVGKGVAQCQNCGTEVFT
jgi:hypothetical protein